MRQLTAMVAIAGLVGLAGCGGSNEGSGSETLFVKATAESDGSTDGSWLAVEVREGSSEGAIVTDAVVTVRGDDSGEFNLPWEGINWGGFRAGAYVKRDLAWDTGWNILVKRGEDGLEAYLSAPGITNITEPLGGTTFKRGDGNAMMVRWKDGEGRRAELVEVDFSEADEADRDLAEDTLELEVEPNRLVATDRERLEVRRTNEVKLAGGTPGSVFKATTRHRIEFKVE